MTCFLCDQYLETPKDLPCKHSYCRTCLQQFCLTNATDTGFPCPKCRAQIKVKDPNQPITEWVDTIPTNEETDKRLEKIRMLEREKRKEKCMFCLSKWKAISATKYCKACREYFCTECGNQHWLLRRSKDHRVWLIEDLITLKTDALLRSCLDFVFNSSVRNKRLTGSNNDRNIEDGVNLANSEVTGATFLPNNYVVLADKGNEKIKLFDDHYQFVTAYKIPCHDVLAFNDYFIVVTCPVDSCMYILSIYNRKIEHDEKIALDAECYGLCYIDNELDTNNFAVTLAKRPIQILLYSGLKQTGQIDVAQGKITMLSPAYLTYSKSKQLFFISDKIHQCLKCINRAGEVVWEKRIAEACGLSIFHDNVLLARRDRKTVDLIKISGQIIKSVVSIEAGLAHVNTLCNDHWFRSNNTTKVLVTDDTDLVRIFLIEDPLLDEDIRIFIDRSPSSRRSSVLDPDQSSTEEKSSICTIV